VDPELLRNEFPVLQHAAYLNAGSDGPLPARAVAAATAELERELARGRTRAHFDRRRELEDELRRRYASLLGADSRDVALTTCTTEGIASVIAGLPLDSDDEIVTSNEEHPGLLGALAAARELRGVEIHEVPFGELDSAVGPRTRLVACSHVSWMTGRVAPAGLADVDVPVLLDGAQGVGAIPTDVAELGCDAYAGAGQKWLCGPDGSGMLYVSPAMRELLAVPRRGYSNLADPTGGLDGALHDDARRFDTPALSAEAIACALGSLDVLESHGWEAVHARGAALAVRLVELLRESGREVIERDETTLVSFTSPDAESERDRLADAGVLLRNIPDRPWLRASVGAWNDEADLHRLMATLATYQPAGG
jgi:selenocysteine lyase/cysteine desulfurase